jgi:hypothetical protein
MRAKNEVREIPAVIWITPCRNTSLEPGWSMPATPFCTT